MLNECFSLSGPRTITISLVSILDFFLEKKNLNLSKQLSPSPLIMFSEDRNG